MENYIKQEICQSFYRLIYLMPFATILTLLLFMLKNTLAIEFLRSHPHTLQIVMLTMISITFLCYLNVCFISLKIVFFFMIKMFNSKRWQVFIIPPCLITALVITILKIMTVSFGDLSSLMVGYIITIFVIAFSAIYLLLYFLLKIL